MLQRRGRKHDVAHPRVRRHGRTRSTDVHIARSVTGGRTRADLRAFRALITMLAVLAGLALVYVGWHVLSIFAHILWLLVFAALLAFVVAPAITWLERRKVPRAVAVLGVYLLIFGVIGYGISLAITPLSTQFTALTTNLPNSVTKLKGHTSSIDSLFRRWHLPFTAANLQQQALSGAQRVANGVLPTALSLVTSVIAFIVDLVLVIVLSIYLLIDIKRIQNNALRILPERYRNWAFFTEAAMIRVVGGYIRGQLIMALIIGAAYGVGCFVLGVHYPLVIGVLAGFFELIPMIGPVLGALPALAIALSQSFSLALWVLVYYVVIQQLESHILGPRITGRAVGLHPVAAILALVAGIDLDGLVGGLLAVPFVGLVYVLGVAIYWEATGKAIPAPRRTTWFAGRKRAADNASSANTSASAPISNTAGLTTPQPPVLEGIEDRVAGLRASYEQTEAERTPEATQSEPASLQDEARELDAANR